MEQKTIDKIKLISNIVLAILLLLNLYYIVAYKQDVAEAMNYKEPDRLMKLFEEKTSTKCLCGNPELGQVIFIANKDLNR